MKGIKVTTIRLDEGLYNLFKARCSENGIFVSDAIIELIVAYLDIKDYEKAGDHDHQ